MYQKQEPIEEQIVDKTVKETNEEKKLKKVKSFGLGYFLYLPLLMQYPR